MKKILFVLLIGFIGYSQEELKITKDGYAPVVQEIEGKTATELYSKTKEWIQTYYKNPSEVLKGDIPNEMIRVDGYASNGFYFKSLGMKNYMDYEYTIEIDFKDGKYRYNVSIGQFWTKSTKALYGYKAFFKRDGSTRKAYEVSVEEMNKRENATFMSLYNYLTGKTEERDSDW